MNRDVPDPCLLTPEASRILDIPQGDRSIVPLNDSVCRSDWKFGSDWAEFRGTRFHLAPRPLAYLRAFVAAGKPLSHIDLREIVFWDRPDISDSAVKGVVHRLRRTLIRALKLPTRFDPLKCPYQTDTWQLRIH